MPNFAWYGPPVYRYRNEKGQFISTQTVWNYQNAGLSAAADKVTYLAEQLGSNAISLPDWQRAMRAEIKRSIGQQYTLGLGGNGNLTSSDYGSMGGIAADQYHYLDNFAARIANEEYSEKQIAAISRMYANSTREAFERAGARIRGIPELPAYPGDGSTICKTNCKCHWSHHYRNGRWESYWTLDVVENCADCLSNADEWNPYISGGI